MCHSIASVYEDLFTLFDFYFISMDPKNEAIHGDNLIFVVVDLIKRDVLDKWETTFNSHDIT